MTLDGLRVIVTGASSGLGAHTVRDLAGRGANVLAAARRIERVEALAAELADGPGRVVPMRADVTLDALVNNAGSEVQAPIERLSEADFEGMAGQRGEHLPVHPCGAA